MPATPCKPDHLERRTSGHYQAWHPPAATAPVSYLLPRQCCMHTEYMHIEKTTNLPRHLRGLSLCGAAVRGLATIHTPYVWINSIKREDAWDVNQWASHGDCEARCVFVTFPMTSSTAHFPLGSGLWCPVCNHGHGKSKKRSRSMGTVGALGPWVTHNVCMRVPNSDQGVWWGAGFHVSIRDVCISGVIGCIPPSSTAKNTTWDALFRPHSLIFQSTDSLEGTVGGTAR